VKAKVNRYEVFLAHFTHNFFLGEVEGEGEEEGKREKEREGERRERGRACV